MSEQNPVGIPLKELVIKSHSKVCYLDLEEEQASVVQKMHHSYAYLGEY